MSFADVWQKSCSYFDRIKERFGLDVWMHHRFFHSHKLIPALCYMSAGFFLEKLLNCPDLVEDPGTDQLGEYITVPGQYL